MRNCKKSSSPDPGDLDTSIVTSQDPNDSFGPLVEVLDARECRICGVPRPVSRYSWAHCRIDV